MSKENDTYMLRNIQKMKTLNLSYDGAVKLVGCIAIDKLPNEEKLLVSYGKESVLYSSSLMVLIPAYPFEIEVRGYYLIVDGDCELDHREWIPTEYSMRVKVSK